MGNKHLSDKVIRFVAERGKELAGLTLGNKKTTAGACVHVLPVCVFTELCVQQKKMDGRMEGWMDGCPAGLNPPQGGAVSQYSRLNPTQRTHTNTQTHISLFHIDTIEFDTTAGLTEGNKLLPHV